MYDYIYSFVMKIMKNGKKIHFRHEWHFSAWKWHLSHRSLLRPLLESFIFDRNRYKLAEFIQQYVVVPKFYISWNLVLNMLFICLNRNTESRIKWLEFNYNSDEVDNSGIGHISRCDEVPILCLSYFDIQSMDSS